MQTRFGICPICGGRGALGTACQQPKCEGALRVAAKHRPRPQPRPRPAGPDATVLVPIMETPSAPTAARRPAPPRRPRPPAPKKRLPKKPRAFRAKSDAGAEKTVMFEIPTPTPPPVMQHVSPTHLRPAMSGTAASDLARAMSQSVIPGEATVAPEEAARPDPTLGLEQVSPFSHDWTKDGLPAPPTETEEGVEATPGVPRRRLLPLFTGLGGLGVGVLIGALGFSSTAPPPPPPAPAVIVAVPEPATTALASADASATDAAAAQSDAAPSVGSADAKAATAAKARPAWAKTADDLNPMVPVPAAKKEVVLGLDESETGKAGSGRLTGFDPAMNVLAPRYAYKIQTHEVTWKELGLYIATLEGNAPAPPRWASESPDGIAQLPATGIRWRFAQDYCEALGGDLPSEAEWSWAARGPELRDHPWGDSLPDARKVRFRRGDPVPLAKIGTQPMDATPGKRPIRGMLANAAEWTRDEWIPNHPDAELPKKADGDVLRAVRGWPLGEPGSGLPPEGLTLRRPMCSDGPCLESIGDSLEFVGFRCVTR